MRPLALTDVVDIARYELERPAFRRSIIDLKRHRRVSLGDFISVVFENRETMRFQVQEMMRAERTVLEERIQEELDTYNQLVPGPNQLKATLLIEITDNALIRPMLDRFQGIDRGGSTFLVVGGERVEGEYEGGRSSEIKLSAVHYVTWTLTSAEAEAVRTGRAPLSLAIDHPRANYRHETPLPPEVCAQLAADLAAP